MKCCGRNLLLLLATQILPAATRWHGRDGQHRAAGRQLNLRPIVGILTQPTRREGIEQQARSYIEASFVKFVEQAGARAVPIHYDATKAELKHVFGRVNGLLFTGGATDLFETPLLRESAAHLFDLAVAANDAGYHFPLWGTCQGFQLLIMLSRYRRGTFPHDGGVMCRNCFMAMNMGLPLNFAEPAASQSRLYGRMAPDLKQWLADAKSTANFHDDGFESAKFRHDVALSQFWTITGTSRDIKKVPFVASVEAKNYPFLGVQVRACARAASLRAAPAPLPRPSQLHCAHQTHYMLMPSSTPRKAILSSTRERKRITASTPCGYRSI